MPETTLCICLSIVAVVLVVLVITADPVITTLVFLCVAMTDLFLFGHIYYMDLTFNPLTSLNVVISMGISVDYSCHIAYAYLLEPIPEDCDTKAKIRHHKTTAALRKMGSSVFHGGFSTFVAIFALVVNKTYVGRVIFRLWFGMIFFGLANGFLLLPVLLSLIGPTHQVEDATKADEQDVGKGGFQESP